MLRCYTPGMHTLPCSLFVLATVVGAAFPAAALNVAVPSTGSAPTATTPVAQAQAWLATNGWHNSDVRVERFGVHQLVRARLHVGNVPVHGGSVLWQVRADGSLQLVRAPQGNSDVTRAFVVAAHEATRIAFDAVEGAVVRDVTVERIDGVAVPRYTLAADGLHPAWVVRVASWSPSASRDVVVDATDGHIVAKQPVMQHGGTTEAKARVFENAPDPTGVDADDLVTVDLEDLTVVAEGSHLLGNHFETFNCCKQHVCLDNTTDCINNIPEGQTAFDVARCATQDDIDAGIAVETYLTPDPVPLSSLPIPPGLPFELPDPLYLKVAFCAELPSLQATEEAGELGFFAVPVDADRAASSPACGQPGADARGCAAEVEGFPEVQSYHTTQQFFEHVRGVLGDDTLCLTDDSMSCEADGTPVLNGDGRPEKPFHIGTNVLFPEFDLQALGIQIAIGGAGGSAANPVIIDDFQRIPNAAFIPALTGGSITLPPGTEALAQLFYRPFDSNIYFQGPRDFAYDGDIVRHEFTHALVHHYVPALASLGKDEQGTHAMSGALNEAWSDYFSSSFSGDPSVGDYAGLGLAGAETAVRNNDNDFRCPDVIIGQVHNDSEPWSGALWEMRAWLLANTDATAPAIDLVVLEAMAQADDDEDFVRAASRVRAGVAAAFGEAAATNLDGIFAARGLSSCERVWPLASVDDAGTLTTDAKEALALAGSGDVGLTNYAPAPVQFRVQVPAASSGFTLSWEQSAGGFFGNQEGGDPPSVLVVETPSPIRWSYEGDVASPRDAADAAIAFVPADARATVVEGANGAPSLGSFTHIIPSDPCAARSFMVQIVSTQAATLQNIRVEVATTEDVCAPAEGEGEGEGGNPGTGCCGGSPAGTVFGIVALLLTRRRRK
jgi:hypothetical protein